MDNCAKCGKELSWNDKHGLILGPLYKKHPEYTGKKVCRRCQRELMGIHMNKCQNCGESYELTHKCKASGNNMIITSPFKEMKDSEYTACIDGLGLLEGEEIKSQYVCRKQTLSARSVFDASQRIEEKKGLLIFTNQNMIFMQQQGSWSSTYSQALRIPLENISGMVIGGTFLKQIRIRVGTGGYPEEHQFTEVFWGKNGMVQVGVVQIEINMILKEARENQKISKERERIQIILDFSSLKDVMTKGGLVMSTYKCPNCNGMVDLPEVGKVLMCKYCGTPIKPVDIFEKIKSLMQ